MKALSVAVLAVPLLLQGWSVASLDEAVDALERASIRAGTPLPDNAYVLAIARVLDPHASLMTASPRAHIEANAEMLPGGISYVKIPAVTDSVNTQLMGLAETWICTNCHGVVMDLRGAGGNGYTAVGDVAAVFAPPETSLFRVFDAQQELRRHVVAGRLSRGVSDAPVMVLADGGTHGAAELLVALLKAQRGVMLIGQKTAGDMRVRTSVTLPDGAMVMIATGSAVPEGRSADGPHAGIVPDICEMAGAASGRVMPDRHLDGRPFSAEAERDRRLMERVAGDRPLRRACEILIGLNALGTKRPALRAVSSPAIERPEDK